MQQHCNFGNGEASLLRKLDHRYLLHNILIIASLSVDTFGCWQQPCMFVVAQR